MPVATVASADGRIDIFSFFGHVTKEEVLAAAARSFPETTHGGLFSTLLIFDPKTDLSVVDAPALSEIHRFRTAQIRRLKLKRRAGAAVVDGSMDARLILSLWNALCGVEAEFDLRFELFDKIEPALRWLGVAKKTGTSLIANLA